MRPEEIIPILNRVEAEFPVTRWKVAGIDVWPLVRAELWWANNDDYAERRRSTRYGSRLGKVAVVNEMVAGVFRKRKVERKDAPNADAWTQRDALFLGDSVSRIRIDEVWYDRLCEPLIEKLEERDYTSLHLEPYHLYRTPRNRPSLFIQTELDRNVFRARRRNVGANLEGYSEMLATVRSRGGETAQLQPAHLTRRAALLSEHADWFGRRLDEVQAKAAFVVDHHLVTMALHLASHRRGIPTIEIQHGLINPSHWAYARWGEVPSDGFELMPDYVWTWDALSAKNIVDSPGQCRPLLGGNLWLDRWVSGEDPLVQRTDQLLQAAGLSDDRRVLVTLQTGFTDERQIRDLREAIARRPEWTWWVRLHPVMSDREVQTVREGLQTVLPFEQVRWATDEPLYSLLRNADVHHTHNSSATLEAMRFGVPTILGDRSALSFFPDGAVSALSGDLVADLESAQRRPPQTIAAAPDESFDIIFSRDVKGGPRQSQAT